jgi:predicted DsbA family dithiol-disulfide isomerase
VADEEAPVKIEIWSDVVCPWCYLGKRRLERALAQREGEEEPEIAWRSFQLQPDAPRFGESGAGSPTEEYLAARGFSPAQIQEMNDRLTELAAAEGLRYRLDRAHHVNTLEAHRRIQAAARHGEAGPLVERLFRAQLVEGLRIDDPDVLDRLGREVGRSTPDDDPAEDGRAVEADIDKADRLRVGGVPFFVFDGRLAVSGARSSEMLLKALEQAAAAT